MNIKIYTKGILAIACCGILFTSCEKDEMLEPSAATTVETGDNSKTGGILYEADPTFLPDEGPVFDPHGAGSARNGEYEWGQIKTNQTFHGVTPNTNPTPPTPPIIYTGAAREGADVEWGQIQTSFEFSNATFSGPNSIPTIFDYGNRSVITVVEPDCGFPIVNSSTPEK